MKLFNSLWVTVCIAIGLIVVSWTSIGYSTDQEFVQSVEWMYQEGFTQYDTVEKFMPWATVTREQWAKFLSELWRLENSTDTNDSDFAKSAEECQFSDLWSSDSTLSESIVFVCQVWLMQWNNNRFFPKEPMTKAQVITTLIRMETWMLDETVNPWRQNYYFRAFNQWLTKEFDTWQLDKTLTRYEIALLLSRTAGNEFAVDATQAEIEEIAQILGLREWLEQSDDSQ